MGFYVGSHDYTILDRSKSDELRLRTKGSGGLGWFWKITNKE